MKPCNRMKFIVGTCSTLVIYPEGHPDYIKAQAMLAEQKEKCDTMHCTICSVAMMPYLRPPVKAR